MIRRPGAGRLYVQGRLGTSIELGAIGEIQDIVVPAHQVAHPGGNRKIDIRLILRIPFKAEDVRYVRNEHGSLRECRKELIDNLIRQSGELLSHSRTSQYIVSFR